MTEPANNDIISAMREKYGNEGENTETSLLIDILGRVPSQIEKFQDYLKEDVDAISRLGNMKKEELKANIESLDSLLGLLNKWKNSPRAFGVSVRDLRETDQGVVLALKLREPSDPKSLPVGQENAQKQLSFYLDFRSTEGLVTRQEVLDTLSFKGLPPQKVLELCKKYLPRQASIIINTASVWIHPRTETTKIDPGAGIEFRYSGGRVSTRGVAFIGVSRLFSDDLSTGEIKPEEMVFLREKIKDIYPPRSH